ncbi:hypothetical protein [Bacillus weihaiensis]|uniref:hypothetical protein n=1 Tax=Bacillus weihaiensis TaxID=1547283 RepID=UPI0023545E3A|nr:hypothetical protein [Bacillus weihaiensis]
MESAVIHNGVEYTVDDIRDLVSRAVDVARKVWNRIVDTLQNFAVNLGKYLVELSKFLGEQPGYKRLYKQEYLDMCESMSEGKSNNWRKAHGLHLRRNFSGT